MDILKEVSALALDILMKAGADDAVVTASESVTNEFTLAEDEFTLFRTLTGHGLTLTVIKDHKKGSIAINSFEEEDIRKAAEDCMAVAAAGVPDEAWGLNPVPETGSYSWGVRTPDVPLFFDRCRELKETIAKDYPRILITELCTEHKGGRSIYRSSTGALFESEGGSYGVGIDMAGNDGENTSSFFYTGVDTIDLSVPLIDQDTIRRDLTAAENSIDTVPVEGKFTGTLVMEPGCAADFILGALGQFAGETGLIDDTSIWKDKLGEMVASPLLTVSAAPLDDRTLGGERWTGEGFISEDYDIIKDGRLNSFMLSLYGANKTGLQRSKNTSASFIIEPGDKSLDDIIKGVKNGLLIGRFSGGQPSVNGDFSGVAKNAFRIADGKVEGAVSETMISGNLAEMLKNITAISKEYSTGGELIPWVAADGVIISGK